LPHPGNHLRRRPRLMRMPGFQPSAGVTRPPDPDRRYIRPRGARSGLPRQRDPPWHRAVVRYPKGSLEARLAGLEEAAAQPGSRYVEVVRTGEAGLLIRCHRGRYLRARAAPGDGRACGRPGYRPPSRWAIRPGGPRLRRTSPLPQTGVRPTARLRAAKPTPRPAAAPIQPSPCDPVQAAKPRPGPDPVPNPAESYCRDMGRRDWSPEPPEEIR